MQQGSKRAWLGFLAAVVLAASVLGYRSWTSKETDAPVSAESRPTGEDRIATLSAKARQSGKAEDWQMLGWALFEAGRHGEAADAYREATRINPQGSVLWSSLGEALVLASERDPMPPEALAAFRRAHELDAQDPRARYFLAVARDLSGDHKGAISDWLALLADTPPGAPWEADLRRTIEQVGKINRIETAADLAGVKQPATEAPVATQAIPGPSAEQMQAASAMTPSQQRAMAEAMVAQLEAKLAANPGNVDRWVMLMRSRMTLDQRDKAKAALAAAIRANAGAEASLRSQARLLGVE